MHSIPIIAYYCNCIAEYIMSTWRQSEFVQCVHMHHCTVYVFYTLPQPLRCAAKDHMTGRTELTVNRMTSVPLAATPLCLWLWPTTLIVAIVFKC